MRRDKSRHCKHMALVTAALLAVGSVFPAQAAQSSVYGQYLSGENAGNIPGTEAGYTRISLSTEGDLAEFARNCQVDSWSRDKYVTLEGDIALQEHQDLSIPVFGGIFDGQGYGISGLDIRTSGSAAGLFRYVQEGGVVRNLSVSGMVHPEGSGNRVGLLAGVNYGQIKNCSAFGSVAGSGEIGGLVGCNQETGQIRKCQSAAVVTGDHSTGGICGANYGTLNNCQNTGNINTFSQEVSYSLEDITMENLEDINSLERVAVHMDTGGVTGYSEGKIYYCTNSGTVGYQHVGYNVGGVVGRLHQGYLQNCTNSGHVLGRKDVGGIAGQMEPFLEIQYLNDRLGDIDRETGRFLDLLEAFHDDLNRYSSETVDLAGSISRNLQSASAAAGNLTTTASDLWYLYNQELTGVSSDINRLNQEWESLSDGIRDREEDRHLPEISVSGGDGIFSSVSGSDIHLPDTSPITNVFTDIESYAAALRRFGSSTSNRIHVVTSTTKDKSGGINTSLETLDRELQAASASLVQLTDVAGEGIDRTGEDIDALFDQARVLRKLFQEVRDDLFRYEGISIEDVSDEVAGGEMDHLGAGEQEEEAWYDTSTFQKGKITLCINTGLVEADTSVGGIVGQVATELDFDPEDDIAVSGQESFRIEQSIKAVVRESRNLGDVTGKKDYVGGIVGRADFGAVISCESYGNVSSTGGSTVGGIAGSSGYCVRSCYSMGRISGKNYVGGIVGRGSDIFYCYTYPEIDFTGEAAGSIAGWVNEEGVLYGNYYVRQEEAGDPAAAVPGVDSIGYEGAAEPLSYEEFCSRKGVPEAFRTFTVIFQAQGRKLASIQCSYGDRIDLSQVPQIPPVEGYFGVWPDYAYGPITGSRVLEAQYEKWVSTLASGEKDEQGRSMVLVEGRFLPGAYLTLEQTPEGCKVSAARQEGGACMEQGTRELVVRVLCENPEESAIELWEEGAYRQVPSRVMGSCLEFTVETSSGENGGALCVYQVTEPEETAGNNLLLMAAAAIAALTVVLLVARSRKKKKKA